jgi:hypothetical protein
MAKSIRGVMVVLTLLVGASTARAEPYVIQAPSTLQLDFESDVFGFFGSGFSVTTLPNMTGGFGPFFTDGSPALHCDPCSPGDPFDPSFQTNGEISFGRGNATFGDTTYSDVSLVGTLDFMVTPLPFPSSTSSGFYVQTPFSFNGTIRGLDDSQQLFNAAFTGNGHVVRFFDRLDDGRYVGGENQIVFAFDSSSSAPVPEPATLVLLASGLGGVLARARSRVRPGREP